VKKPPSPPSVAETCDPTEGGAVEGWWRVAVEGWKVLFLVFFIFYDEFIIIGGIGGGLEGWEANSIIFF
jgi:hypothetical protein